MHHGSVVYLCYKLSGILYINVLFFPAMILPFSFLFFVVFVCCFLEILCCHLFFLGLFCLISDLSSRFPSFFALVAHKNATTSKNIIRGVIWGKQCYYGNEERKKGRKESKKERRNGRHYI